MNVLIVLCGGKPHMSAAGLPDLGKETEIDKQGNLLYVGGRLRLDAAVLLSEKDMFDHIVVVGGSVTKVQAMRRYMLASGCKKKVAMLVSDADTTGNLWAIRIAIEKRIGIFHNGTCPTLHILTSAFHQHRALRFAADILPTYRIVPLVAEAFIGSASEQQEIMTDPQYGYTARMLSEVQGLRDWESGTYRKQYGHSTWRCRFLSDDDFEEND